MLPKAATHLGVTRQALSRLINEKSGISADMALRLAKAFHTSASFWMNLETQYELWQAEKVFKAFEVEPFDKAA